jgi:5-deoxy-glucuronate isomerase
MTTLAPIDATTCVVRDTGSRRGRHISVSPATTAARHLHFGRIVLDSSDPLLTFSTEDRETALICLRGEATIRHPERSEGPGRAGGAPHTQPGPSLTLGMTTLAQYDALYLPRDTQVTIQPGPEGCDLAEVAAPVEKQYPPKLVRFEEVRNDPALHFHTGGPSAERDLNVLIGKNVEAGRIMAGVTFSKPGNWTSWPPHEHARMLEEAYLYIDMPSPGWGLQLVYNDTRQPELVAVVREGDVVLMPQGYHPNVSAPGGTINFLWMMAAIREGEDRQFGVVNVQPEYAAGGSGLEASRK